MRRVSGVQGAVRSVVRWWWEHWQEFEGASRGCPRLDATGRRDEES
jgi:hypothetical protein